MKEKIEKALAIFQNPAVIAAMIVTGAALGIFAVNGIALTLAQDNNEPAAQVAATGERPL